jgi:hypothetical protein
MKLRDMFIGIYYHFTDGYVYWYLFQYLWQWTESVFEIFQY